MTDQFYNPGSENTGSYDPKNDLNFRTARTGEQHAAPREPIEGEGVITGHAPDHYVHLANGAVIPGTSVGTHYHDPEMGLVPIVSRFPAGRELPR